MKHESPPPGVSAGEPAAVTDAPHVGLPDAVLRDPSRLAAVYATGLLDSDVEEVFDRLTRLAVRLLGVPAAFITLVDAERDFYKSACGFGEPLATFREITGPTFCHFTVQRTTPLVIPDTVADPLYRDVPTVRTLGVAAYVGVPLMAGGQAIGAFCAIDTQPRAWTAREVEVLVELAASAQREVELRGAVTTSQAAVGALALQTRELTGALTELRHTERALHRSEERYEFAARATNNAIWDWDLETGEVRWNPGVYTVFGYADGDVAETAAWWYEHIHFDDRERVVGGIHAVIDNPSAGNAWRESYRYRRGDGTYAEVMDCGYVKRDATGRAVRMVGAMADITAARLTERERDQSLTDAEGARATAEAARADAERARRETARILAATGEGILGTDADGRTTFANAAAERLLGWSAAELIGRPQHALIHHSRPDGTAYPVDACPLYRAQYAGELAHVENEVFWRKNGTALPVEYDMTPILEGDTVVGAVVNFRDVTARLQAAAERERLLREAEDAREQAEDANRAKAQFLATMSHELRTPLNAIGGYAELMQLGLNGPVTPDQLTSLDRIRRSQRHLLGLINGVLNFAKMDAGAVEYAVEDVALDEVLATCEALIAPQVRAKQLKLRYERCDPRLTARADREKVQQVVLNLLSNAVKFTERGGRVTMGCASTNKGQIEVRVADTGHGIAAEQLERVFHPFVQVDANLTRTEEGTGLGLAISRDLARGMGGDLAVKSEPGVGSIFTLTLPAT